MEFDLTITVTLYFSVTFVTNGGSSADPLKVAADGLASVPADPARKNWIFGGWFSDAALTISWDFSADVVTEDIVLYAKWERDPDITYHTVTFVTNGGTSVGTQTVAHGDTIIPITTSGTDRIFAGWYLSPDLTGPEWDITDGEVTSDMTLYAKWEQSTDAVDGNDDDDDGMKVFVSSLFIPSIILGLILLIFIVMKKLKERQTKNRTKDI